MSYTLLLRHNGTAELLNERDETVWSSDADEDFKDEVSAEFLQESDVEAILDYLVEEKILSETQADEAICEEESLEGDGAAASPH